MKSFLIILLLISAYCLPVAFADEAPFSVTSNPVEVPRRNLLPGVDLAQGLSLITGTAISPLLGVSSAGAWRYYHTSDALRDKLPWYCHPGVWGFGFAILALCLIKDVLGTLAPPLIKKPFDLAELFESKLSALVASTAFVPFIAAQASQHFGSSVQVVWSLPPSLSPPCFLPLAAVSLDLQLVLIPISVLAFLVVWMAAHAIHVLIVLCPFGFIDSLLKLTKTGLLSTLVLSYLIHPFLGAAVSLLIIGVAVLLAPAAFRLSTFGVLFATDTFTPWRAERSANPAEAHAFVARTLAGVPSRTYGRLVRMPDGKICFRYRPWFVFPARLLELPAGSLSISQGMYFPSLFTNAKPSGTRAKLLFFLPRYRTRERAIADHFGIADIHDSPLNKGFKAARAWLTESFRPGFAGKGEGPSTHEA